MRIHFEDIYKTALGELHFEKMRSESLLESVREIKVATNDKITERLADMAIERFNLD